MQCFCRHAIFLGEPSLMEVLSLSNLSKMETMRSCFKSSGMGIWINFQCVCVSLNLVIPRVYTLCNFCLMYFMLLTNIYGFYFYLIFEIALFY